MGMDRALKMSLLSEIYPARQALELGLVTEVVADAELMDARRELAARLAEGPPIAIRLTKRMMYKQRTMELDNALEDAAMATLVANYTEDVKEGTAAFHEKRKPQVQGQMKKAWRVHAWGEPETMALEDVAEPEPGRGQVRIRNHAAALNFFDILQVQGKYQIKPPFPFTPGAEVAGVVDAVGAGRDVGEGGRSGDGDAARRSVRGIFASRRQASVFAMPAAMSFEEAAAMPIVYHTSYFAMTHRTRFARANGCWCTRARAASGCRRFRSARRWARA